LVKKVNLSHYFDQACRGIIEFVSKEKIATTIMNQHKHPLPLGAKMNNLEPFDNDYDFEAMSQSQRHGRSTGKLSFPYDNTLNGAMKLYALQRSWVDKLSPEEKWRFENQLCIGCGQPGHIRWDCPKKPNRHVQPFVQPRNNNYRTNSSPQHNMGG
jgi:hypothetical protein